MLNNFGELKETVKKYLYNRKDLDLTIPTLVALSERRIYRALRVPANEELYSATITDTNEVVIPRDFLECKFFALNYEGKNLELQRVSDNQMLRMQAEPDFVAQPKYFARIGNYLRWYPQQDSESVAVQMMYWADYSGQLVADADTNDILRIAPDLYVYGALVESEPFLGHDDRIPVWNDMFNQALAQVIEHAQQAEMAGSQLEYKAVYS